MNILSVGNIDVDIVRKNIKNIHLTVYPPDGRVRLAVPEKMDDEAARIFIISKIDWITKQRKKFKLQERQSESDFVSGETHYFLGSKYLLNLIETRKKQHVEIRNNKYMDLYVRPGSCKEKKEKILMEWYRENLKKIVPEYIEKWEKVMGVTVNEFGIKRMKTRWGTCNVQAKRIWINLELAEKNPRCIEYIVVHEMVHLLERHHNDIFKAYMNKFLPNWKSIKDELNGFI